MFFFRIDVQSSVQFSEYAKCVSLAGCQTPSASLPYDPARTRTPTENQSLDRANP